MPGRVAIIVFSSWSPGTANQLCVVQVDHGDPAFRAHDCIPIDIVSHVQSVEGGQLDLLPSTSAPAS